MRRRECERESAEWKPTQPMKPLTHTNSKSSVMVLQGDLDCRCGDREKASESKRWAMRELVSKIHKNGAVVVVVSCVVTCVVKHA